MEHQVDVVFWVMNTFTSGWSRRMASGISSLARLERCGLATCGPFPTRRSATTAIFSFMLIEIAGGALYFRTVNRLGETIDRGKIVRTRRSS